MRSWFVGLAASLCLATASAQSPVRLRIQNEAPRNLPTSLTLRLAVLADGANMDIVMKGHGNLALGRFIDGWTDFTLDYPQNNLSFAMTGTAPKGTDTPVKPESFNITGKTNTMGMVRIPASDDEEADQNPIESLFALGGGLQGLVYPTNDVKPGDTWEAPVDLGQGDAEDLTALLSVIGKTPYAQMLYLGNETKNGRTYAKIRRTFRVSIDSTTLGLPEEFNLSMSSGGIFYVNIKNGLVHYSEETRELKMKGGDQNIAITARLKTLCAT